MEQDPVLVVLLCGLAHLKKLLALCSFPPCLVLILCGKCVLFPSDFIPRRRLSGHSYDLQGSIMCLDRQWPGFKYFLWLTAVLTSRPMDAHHLGQSQLLKHWFVCCHFRAVVLIQGSCRPQGTFSKVQIRFGLSATKEEVQLASSSWSQGCCRTSHSVQYSPPPQQNTWPKCQLCQLRNAA